MMYNNQPVAVKRPVTAQPAKKQAAPKKKKKVWESPDDIAFGKRLQEKWARRRKGQL